MKKQCSVYKCENKYFCKGYCIRHYRQMVDYGKILERTINDPNHFWFENNICYIQIYNNKNMPKCVVMIDREDYEKVKDFKWKQDHGNRGVISNNKVGYLSRLITSTTDPKIEVDHKNHNILDNRKENLRPCTRSQNQANQLKHKNNTSGYKGVCWSSNYNKWAVMINHNKERVHLGYFINKEDAARAYNEAAIKYHGEFALLNKIEEE